MPGGLRDVVQRFDADGSGYIAEIQRMIAANRDLIASIAEVKAAIASIEGKSVKIDVDTGGAMAGIAAVKAALGDLPDTKEVTVAVKYVGGDGPGGIGLGGDTAGMIRELRDISASMDQATSSLGRMEDHLAIMRRDVADSSADLMMQTQILRDNADAHTAAGYRRHDSRGSAGTRRRRGRGRRGPGCCRWCCGRRRRGRRGRRRAGSSRGRAVAGRRSASGG